MSRPRAVIDPTTTVTPGVEQVVIGRCAGKCKGERGAIDSPAKWGLDRGRKVLYCPCCNLELSRAKGSGTPDAAPNLNPALLADTARYVDDVCGYDVVVLRAIREK